MAVVVVTVRVEVAVPFAAGVTDVKLNPQVTVELTGAIAHINPTAELKLFDDVTVMVEVVLLPATVVADTGAALTLKLFTVNA